MSLYNVLHGENSDADLLLAAIGLSREGVGRYRDCWVTNDGEIAVYTRNGGGNRDCWCEGNPEYGVERCKHEPFTVVVDEHVRMDGSPRECGCGGTTTYLGTPVQHSHKTGRRVSETRYRCLNPTSSDCACSGCVIEYRLPAHPLYLRDRDDDFDSTYATVYFRAPDAIPEEYPRGESGDARWQRTLALLRGSY